MALVEVKVPDIGDFKDVAVIELLRSHWITGTAAGMAWVVFMQVERRWQQDSDQG